jgi:type IV pilus assembly protein PilA
MKRQLQQGFTLIELMIVVAIIGILAAVAIPQYQDYVTRARWADPITQIASVKQALAECLQTNNGTLSLCDDTTKLSNTVGFTAPTTVGNASLAVTATTAALVLTGNTTLGGCVVTFTPTPGSAAITWAGATSGSGCTKSKTGV